MNRRNRRCVGLRNLVCGRCGKTTPTDNAPDWNFTIREGVIVGVTCPDCQTPEENAEAFINESITDYDVDAFGRVIGRPKIGAER